MNTLREKVIAEIQPIPVDIHQFAGVWADMSEDCFAEFETEWKACRQQTFNRRLSQ